MSGCICIALIVKSKQWSSLGATSFPGLFPSSWGQSPGNEVFLGEGRGLWWWGGGWRGMVLLVWALLCHGFCSHVLFSSFSRFVSVLVEYSITFWPGLHDVSLKSLRT